MAPTTSIHTSPGSSYQLKYFQTLFLSDCFHLLDRVLDRIGICRDCPIQSIAPDTIDKNPVELLHQSQMHLSWTWYTHTHTHRKHVVFTLQHCELASLVVALCLPTPECSEHPLFSTFSAFSFTYLGILHIDKVVNMQFAMCILLIAFRLFYHCWAV